MNNNEDADDLREWADDYLEDEDNSCKLHQQVEKDKLKEMMIGFHQLN